MISITDIIMKNKNIDSVEKSQIMIKLTEIDNNLIKGCNEYIQFMRLLYFIMSEKRI